METTRDPRGVPTGDGAGGRTPHSKIQLEMTGTASWEDVRVWLHHTDDGTGRLITCVERQAGHGYEYAVVHPHGVETYDLHGFQQQVNANRQPLDVAEKYQKRLWQALNNDLFDAIDILRDLQGRHVAEVVSS